ncbi:MAG: glyoxylate/hydroxypyruvate reductase A [Rubrivivax sp.]|nr:glyoxylate/hydroxypyruvate reductase A [Rubrivivax sp.]
MSDVSPAPPEDSVLAPRTLEVLLCGRFEPGEREHWLQALRAACPAVTWWDSEAPDDARQRIEAAVVANPPPGSLTGLPRLRLIQSLWAGVDRLLRDPSLPPDVPIARMVDPQMTRAMVETALWAVLSLQRGFFAYARRQAQAQWRVHAQVRAAEWPVLVLGQGALGGAVSEALRARGYPVSGWRRSDGPSALGPRLAGSQVVINLLPLTSETQGLIDARFLAALPRKASLVNLARGAQVVDADLLAALDSGHLRHAVLDVFHVEPLPPEHPFWRHPRVTVLPHAAALTDALSAAQVVADNLQRLRRGEAPLHQVDRLRGY